MNKEERILDQLVDQAIKEYPLDPVPRDLFEGIMHQVERSVFKPRLSFSWVDFSFSVLLAALSGVFLELLQSFNRSPYWSAWIRVETQLFWQELMIFTQRYQSSLLAGLISGGTVLLLVILLVGIYQRQLIFIKRLAA
jgi:hypothetical protein